MRGSWKSRSAPVARPNKSPAIGCPPRWCGSHEPGLTPNLEQEPSSHGSLSQEPEHEPSSWFRIRFEPTTGRSLCRRLSIRRSWPLRYSSTDLPQDGLPQLRALKTIAGFLNAKRGTPLIGVANAGKVLGLDVRRFPERGQYRPTPRQQTWHGDSGRGFFPDRCRGSGILAAKLSAETILFEYADWCRQNV